MRSWRTLTATIRLASQASRLTVLGMGLSAAISAGVPVFAGLLGEQLLTGLAQIHAGIEVEKARSAVNLTLLVGGSLAAVGLFLRPFGRVRFERLAQVMGDTIMGRVLHVTSVLDLDQCQTPAYLDLLHRVQSEAPSRSFRMIDGCVRLTRGVFGAAVATFALAPLGPACLLLPLASLPGTWLRDRHQGEDHRARTERAPTERDAAYHGALLGSAAHAKDVRVFGASSHLLDAWRMLTQKAATSRLTLRARHAYREAGADLLVLLASLGVTYIAIAAVIRGEATPASLALRLAAIQGATMALASLGAGIAELRGHARHLDDLDALLAMKPRSSSGTLPIPTPLPSDIVLESVSYRHVGMTRDALTDVSLTIPAGSLVAVTGPNGAGKTTLLTLIAGLIAPEKGRIFLRQLASTTGTSATSQSAAGIAKKDADPEVDLAAIDPLAWRQCLGVAWQDHARFELPLRQVIALGDPALRDDDARIYRALSEVGLSTFADALPQGLDTRIGRRFDGGKEPSAGLWQRLSLARAIVRDAPIVLLDEPSAPLDPESEALLATLVRSWRGKKTVIVVAHRPSLVETADVRIVLTAGRATSAHTLRQST